jgi:hypothetical protein
MCEAAGPRSLNEAWFPADGDRAVGSGAVSQAADRTPGGAVVNTSPEVDAWFAALDHPLKSTMQRVRELVLAADPRMSEMVQYGTVQFVYGSPMANFVQVKDRKRVSLMFNAAGRLQGNFPHLEGKSIKYLRFGEPAEVEQRADELQAIARAWCEYKAQGSGSKEK